MLALAFLPNAPGFAATFQDYLVRTWQSKEGLPLNAVATITQTRDGYIWVGTYNGLARFDGVRFAVFNTGNTPALPNNRITALFEDANTNLWIGHETGEVTRYRDGSFLPVRFSANWQPKIMGIQSDERGEIWLQNSEGWSRPSRGKSR
jgi:ligand-binding sensor domain-containing protein